MSFLSPERLWLLLLPAGLAAGYLWLQHRRRHRAVRYTNLALLRSVAPARAGWRRHVSAAGVGVAMVMLVLAMARPAEAVRVPKEAATVMLVMDMSASMQATDVFPSRQEAAISAARTFVEALPSQVRVGLIAYDRATRTIATPTADHDAVLRGLDSLALGPGTATGDALYAALDAVTAAVESATTGTGGAAIVLLSDGVVTVGRPVEGAAAAAADRGVPVSTIAFGTEAGRLRVGRETIPVPADPATMAQVAEVTSGRFFEADSASELEGVYEDIGTRVGYETVTHENTGPILAAGVVSLTAAFGLALAWNGKLV